MWLTYRANPIIVMSPKGAKEGATDVTVAGIFEEVFASKFVNLNAA